MEQTKTRRRVVLEDSPLPLVSGDPGAVVGFAIGFFGLIALLLSRLWVG